MNKHKIRSKPFYTQILSYDTFEMQKNRQPWHVGNIAEWMFKVSATSVDESMQTLAKGGDWLKNTPYENLIIFKSA